MEKFNFAKTSDTGNFFVDSNNDIFDTKEEADVCGVVAEIIVDSVFCGSAEEMRKNSLAKYLTVLMTQKRLISLLKK